MFKRERPNAFEVIRSLATLCMFTTVIVYAENARACSRALPITESWPIQKRNSAIDGCSTKTGGADGNAAVSKGERLVANEFGLDDFRSPEPTVTDPFGFDVPLAFRAEPALPTGGPVAGGAAPATIGGEGTVAAGEAAGGAAGGLLQGGRGGGDTTLQSILKAAEVAGDPTIRQLLSAFFADRFPSYYDPNAPTMIVPPEGGDFSEGANIVRNPGFVEGSEGLAFASSFDPSAPFWTVPPAGGSFAEGANLVTPPATGGMTASQLAASVAPYLGAAAGGAMSGGEPTQAILMSELLGMLNVVPGLGVATGAGATLAEALGLNKVRPSAMQKKQMNTQFASDLGKQMIVDLQEATTPEELAQVLQSYSSGQYPVTFRSVLGGENVPTVDLDQILGPDFNIGVEGINLGDLGGQIGPSIANMVRSNAQLLKAAQAGDPEAVAQIQGRTAQKARYQSGLKAIQDAGIPLTQEMLRGIYMNAIGDNAFPFTDRAGALQRVSEGNLGNPTLAGPAFAALHAMGVPMPEGQRSAAEELARIAVGSASGGFMGPEVERAQREYQTAVAATQRARDEGLSWDQALAAQRAWEDSMRSGSA